MINFKKGMTDGDIRRLKFWLKNKATGEHYDAHFICPGIRKADDSRAYTRKRQLKIMALHKKGFI